MSKEPNDEYTTDFLYECFKNNKWLELDNETVMIVIWAQTNNSEYPYQITVTGGKTLLLKGFANAPIHRNI